MDRDGTPVMMTLDAVIIAVSDHQPRVLIVEREELPPALPSGALDNEHDVTLELGIRRLIRDQTGLEVGYVEQLYTFGDRDRRIAEGPGRHVSVAYLALVRETAPALAARWIDAYELVPWEDARDHAGADDGSGRAEALRTELEHWAGDDPERRDRIAVAFGPPWDGIRVLDRYELLFGSGLVPESGSARAAELAGGSAGRAMAFDHRRIAATALGRIRGKLTYRPVVFELLPATFRLLDLQHTVEALAGVRLHKQNFRRLVERSGLVEGTGERTAGTAGRPAELFRYRPSVQLERPRPGVGVPYR